AVGVVGLAGVNLLGTLGVGGPDGQGLAALAAFEQPGEQADLAVLPRTLPGAEFLLYHLEAVPVNEGFMLAFHHDPVLGAFVPNGADLEAVQLLLGRDGPRVDRVGQDVLDDAEIPDIAPIFWVGLLPFGEGIPQAPLAVPPGGARNPLFLQPSPDEVRAVTLQRPRKDLPDNESSFRVQQ